MLIFVHFNTTESICIVGTEKTSSNSESQVDHIEGGQNQQKSPDATGH